MKLLILSWHYGRLFIFYIFNNIWKLILVLMQILFFWLIFGNCNTFNSLFWSWFSCYLYFFNCSLIFYINFADRSRFWIMICFGLFFFKMLGSICRLVFLKMTKNLVWINTFIFIFIAVFLNQVGNHKLTINKQLIFSFNIILRSGKLLVLFTRLLLLPLIYL